MADKKSKSQVERFKDAARDAGAHMSKEEFGRVIRGLAKPKLQASKQSREKEPKAEEAS